MDDLQRIAQVVRDSIKEELGSYKMPKEQHYLHHKWTEKKIQNEEKIQDWAKKGLIGVMISAIAGLLYLGFILFGRTQLK